MSLDEGHTSAYLSILSHINYDISCFRAISYQRTPQFSAEVNWACSEQKCGGFIMDLLKSGLSTNRGKMFKLFGRRHDQKARA